MATTPRHFIESQLAPAVQAFEFAGGWHVERRERRKASRAALAASVGEWPCSGPGCTRMVKWQPKERVRGFLPYCSARCANRIQNLRRPAGYKVRRKEYAAARRQQFTPEQKARERELGRRAKAKQYARATPEQKQRRREYSLAWKRANKERWARGEMSPAQLERAHARDHARYEARTPEQIAQQRANARKWYHARQGRMGKAPRKFKTARPWLAERLEVRLGGEGEGEGA